MIIIIVISMLFAISWNHTATAMFTTIENDRGSTKTKGGRNGVKSSKEPDSTDDAFKEMAKRLTKKDRPEKTGDSIVGEDDENPLAQYQMPERPVVPPNQDGATLENIVEMEKKPVSKQPTIRALTPSGGAKTAQPISVAQPPPVQQKSQKSIIPKKDKTITTDKTQSDPRSREIESTQHVTNEDAIDTGKKEPAKSVRKDLILSTKN
ncbi:uncharacterized protein CELE_K01A6.5 [Caenorhabditis elegans]|uniref:Uncharacterized protein n=1 Tax=Caenorhabditis elegans TaxID=6239 RepID=Q21078_CAEEL|nr:Uncharacterized protein CELE_K01A6.5 [Caenorhabditis elegans]CAA92968.7 Uncharacterized protein CELE_K01A6.5 [Caenorhabditis elegans]|eukprot:NP_502224.5 Uncharacterized protein CELE_K01A6.5 [Caenorhabditis elegans]